MTGGDARRLATAALWVGALDLAVDYFTASIAALRDEGRLGLLARSLIASCVLVRAPGDTDDGGI